MKAAKRKTLATAGWRVGSVSEFLELERAEAMLVEVKLGLSAGLRKLRSERGVTQGELARRIGSSQSRVAKMEAGDPSVSMDLLVRSMMALGADRRQIARALEAPAS